MISVELKQQIQRAAAILHEARSWVAFTGAGISTPSGIPDFRSKEKGLWQTIDPLKSASLSVFRQNPDRFYDWFRPLLLVSWNAAPNRAHQGLALLEKHSNLRCLITQNIDGLHQAAGSTRVIELHGSAMKFYCPNCGTTFPTADLIELFTRDDSLPGCRKCDGIIRPGIVMFEEALPQQEWQSAQSEMMKADSLLVAGSSLTVYPAASIPEMALRNGCQVIINNMEPTPLDNKAALVIRADCSIVIPLLVEELIKISC